MEARKEGKRILENFRINTDNPIAILQQEEAKESWKFRSRSCANFCDSRMISSSGSKKIEEAYQQEVGAAEEDVLPGLISHQEGGQANRGHFGTEAVTTFVTAG